MSLVEGPMITRPSTFNGSSAAYTLRICCQPFSESTTRAKMNGYISSRHHKHHINTRHKDRPSHPTGLDPAHDHILTPPSVSAGHDTSRGQGWPWVWPFFEPRGRLVLLQRAVLGDDPLPSSRFPPRELAVLPQTPHAPSSDLRNEKRKAEA
jgi:hypothetical protein